MRRLRPVQIKVSPNFYRWMESEKRKLSEEINRKTGFRKDISIINFTDILANNKIIFPKIKIGGLDEFKKQKRRRI